MLARIIAVLNSVVAIRLDFNVPRPVDCIKTKPTNDESDSDSDSVAGSDDSGVEQITVAPLNLM